MLTEQARGLTARIRALASRRRQADNAKAFRTRADLLREPAQRLMFLAGILALFRQRGISVTEPEEKVRALKAQVDELAAAYLNDPESIVASDAKRRFSFWEPIKGLPQEIEGALQTAWQDYINHSLPVPQPELLTALQRIPAFQKQVSNIREGINQAEQLKKSLPQSAAVFTQVHELGSEMRDAWSQLHSDELSTEIRGFLGAVTSGKATLQDITPEVHQWLERYDMLKSFKVTL